MAYLYLSDGTLYEGEGFGFKDDVIGEVVFNTSMTGYPNIASDPVNNEQLVVMTYPLIGNVGVEEGEYEAWDPESACGASALIVSDYNEIPSNWRCDETLSDWMEEWQIVGLSGIDTRALTRKLRNKGTMYGIITAAEPTEEQKAAVKAYKPENLVMDVTTAEAYDISGEGKRVAIIDFGLQVGLVNSLSVYDYDMRVFPASASADEINAFNPDGIILTPGPGDPKHCEVAIETVKALFGKPMLGIGLGHQVMALAKGADTMKMAYGHRGANQPVKDLKSGRVLITTQNHGYCVDVQQEVGHITHVNWNDHTIEGIEYDEKTFSVQFEPVIDRKGKDESGVFTKFNELL